MLFAGRRAGRRIFRPVAISVFTRDGGAGLAAAVDAKEGVRAVMVINRSAGVAVIKLFHRAGFRDVAAIAGMLFHAGGKAGCRGGHGPSAPIMAERIDRRHIVFGIAAFTFTVMRFTTSMRAIRLRIDCPFSVPIVAERVNISGFGRTAAGAGAGILTDAEAGRFCRPLPVAPSGSTTVTSFFASQPSRLQ